MRTSSTSTGRTVLALLGAFLTSTVLTAPTASADEVRSQQWYLDAMQAEQMWEVSTGNGITVAVIDRKVDTSAAELQGQLLSGKDLSGSGVRGTGGSRVHGTNMAILIAGKRGGSGLTGLAPGAKILPLTAEDIAFDGIINAIRFAADHNARVINISQSAPALDEERVALQKAIDYANRKGSLIFAGTGNHGDDHNIPTSPADLPGVVGVGAIDESLNVADFSVYGPQVALTAPGVNILSRCDGPGYCVKQGTSDSTAIASASAALIWAKHPDWTNNQVLRVMMETAVKPNDGVVPSEYLGYGIVRPRKVLLDNEGDPGPPDVNPLFPDYPPVQNSPSPTAPKDGAEPTPAPEDSDSPEPSDRANDGNADHISPWLIGAGGAVLALTVTGTGYKLIRRQREPR